MNRRVFVPITDEILYDHPELINGPLVPYRPGTPCHHWLAVEINPAEDHPTKPKRRSQRLRYAPEHIRPTLYT